MREVVLGAVDSFELTREYFDMLTAGQWLGLFTSVMTGAAAGAVDKLTAGLQGKLDKAAPMRRLSV